MKNFRVSLAKWANWQDMQLPFYIQWNKNNPLPSGFWQRIWEYPFVASNIPQGGRSLDIGGTYPFVLFKNFPNAISVDIRNLNTLDHPLHKGLWPAEKLIIQDAADLNFANDSFEYSFSISAMEEMDNPLEVILEMIRVTRWKIIITLDISEHLGLDIQRLVELGNKLNFNIPTMPTDCLISNDKRLRSWGIHPIDEYQHIRVLGLVIESVDDNIDCGIIIPHWESYSFASAAIHHIRQRANQRVQYHIYLVDDNSKDGSFNKLQDKFSKDTDITLWQVQRSDVTNANVGHLLDNALKHIEQKYVCMIDADVFPISSHWLSFPIWLLEKYNCSSVGCDTGLSNGYLPNKMYHWQNNGGYIPAFGLYDNENFVCINNFYRIMKTSLAQVVSEQVGFARHVPQSRQVFYRIYRRLESVTRKILHKSSSTNVLQYTDNGVQANYFLDINRLGSKFNLPLLSWVGFTPHDGVFGQNIGNLLFHFALSTRALSQARREVTDAGQQFNYYAEIIQAEGFTDDLLSELLQKQELRPGGYEGQIPISWYETAQQSLKDEFDRYYKSLTGEK